jgi:arylsulfatase A-like enzyme
MRRRTLPGANVLVVVSDTFRADHLGRPGLTPNLDRLASSGVQLTRAYSEAPVTVPARTAMVSGIVTHMERPWSPLRPEDRHLAEVLRSAGYATHAVSDSPFKPRWGFDRGFDTFVHRVGKCQHGAPDGAEPDLGDAHLPDGGDLASESARRLWREWRAVAEHHCSTRGSAPPELTTAEALQVLRSGLRQPFLLWVDYFDPHEPWDPGDRWTASLRDPSFAGRKVVLPWREDASEYSDAEIADLRARYAGNVAQVDAEIGRLLDTVDELGLRERTLVVFLSDHGMLLGEHGRVGKSGMPMYDELARVPMLWRLPAVLPEGAVVDTPFLNADLAPTLCALLGLRWPERPVELTVMDLERPVTPDEGRDASAVLRGEAVEVRPRLHLGAFGLRWAVLEGSLKFIDNGGAGEDELYDLTADPAESVNLVDRRPADVRRLAAAIAEYRRGFFVNYRPLPGSAGGGAGGAGGGDPAVVGSNGSAGAVGAVRRALRPVRRAARRAGEYVRTRDAGT